MTTTLESRLTPSTNINVHYIKDKRRLIEISSSPMSETVRTHPSHKQDHIRSFRSQPSPSFTIMTQSNRKSSTPGNTITISSKATTSTASTTTTTLNISNDITDFRAELVQPQPKAQTGDIGHLETSNDRLKFDVEMATTWHRDPVDDYRMKSKTRGICLIVNNVDFEMGTLPTRKGSDMDAFRFKEIFRQLGFSVESKRNLTSEKMRATFKQVAARCESRHDALVVILLSHGSESGIYGVDVLEVDTNDILTNFDNKRCKKMMNKPKIFIIQACRGRIADFGVKDTQTFFTQPDSQATQPSQMLTIPYSDSPRISRWSELEKNGNPTRTDMILCFSCRTGYVSTRNEEDGSWLGAALAHHLQREAHRKHLIEIFNMVSRDVRKCMSVDGHKQVLEITSIGFDRNLYFNPGLFEEK